ncbi:GAF domain-containing protein [Pengzhenrongella phosphoraccumulans]|uniref:GAF domain-containing protein n=1 Tax=Pengzhenrongella phosphoraccumulans TaxID=3114394 RepID=UPI00388F0ABA
MRCARRWRSGGPRGEHVGRSERLRSHAAHRLSVAGILDELVERIPDVLPITGAGITLISPGLAPQYIAASNEDALQFERLQTELGEGLCLLAFRTGGAVSVPDLACDSRFPRFGPAALAAGMAAVFTFPLWHGTARIGALDLYRDTVGPLTGPAREAAQTLADVAAAYLINAQARQQAVQAADWFRERALHDALTGLPNRVCCRSASSTPRPAAGARTGRWRSCSLTWTTSSGSMTRTGTWWATSCWSPSGSD